MRKNCGTHVRNYFFAFSMVALMLIAVGTASAQAKKPVLRVAVSIPPMQEWVNRLAGDRVVVTLIMPPGSSPHAFEPSPRQLVELGKAQVWFSIGVDFEYSLKPKVRSMYPKLEIVDVTKNVQFRTLRPQEQEEEHKADEENIDPALTNRDQHTWLGYSQAKAEIAVIRDTLMVLDPEGASLYKANYETYMKEIDIVFDSLKTKLAPLSGSKVFVYHPAFGYFLDTFDIVQVAVELGGKEPTQKDLVALVDLAKKEKAKVIFTQAQFSENAAKAVAGAIGAVVIPIDPLAADWLANVSRVGEAMLKAVPGGK